jgi:hypothetical protein
MDNRGFDEFDLFCADLGHESAEPASLEDIKRRYPKILTPGELLEVSNREREQRAEVDPFTRLLEAEQAVTQARIEGAIRQPVEFTKSAAGPEFGEPAKAEVGDLEWALGENEVGDKEPPAITAASRVLDSARVGDHVLAKGTRASVVLSGSFGTIMERVAARASGGARELAKTLAQQWRESEGV